MNWKNLFAKAKSDHDVFATSRQRAKSSFFAIMRPRLRKQNPAKYVDRSALERDLMILQRALKKKDPLEETYDWRLANAIEEYKHRIVDPLQVQWTETKDYKCWSVIPKSCFSPLSYSTLKGWCVYAVFLFSLHVFSFIPTSNDLITSADTLALILLFTKDCSSFTLVMK